MSGGPQYELPKGSPEGIRAAIGEMRKIIEQLKTRREPARKAAQQLATAWPSVNDWPTPIFRVAEWGQARARDDVNSIIRVSFFLDRYAQELQDAQDAVKKLQEISDATHDRATRVAASASNPIDAQTGYERQTEMPFQHYGQRYGQIMQTVTEAQARLVGAIGYPHSDEGWDAAAVPYDMDFGVTMPDGRKI